MPSTFTFMDLIKIELKMIIDYRPKLIEKGLENGFINIYGQKVQLQASRYVPKDQVYIMKFPLPLLNEFEYGVILGTAPISLENDIKRRLLK